ncbi:MAG: hypothetical protein EBR09_01355 [Proteobacteria bacterium]|nr:hypothetical protein [Pseudomonadota bacterium]
MSSERRDAMSHKLRSFLPGLSALSILLSVIGCGQLQLSKKPTPAPTPTAAPTVAPTEAPETTPVSFWLAANPKDGGGPIAVRYDGTGRLSMTVDLVEAGLDYGPITAFNFLDASTLMFFIDAGAGKETIGTLDIKSAIVKNKAWGSESSIKTAFSGARANTLVTGFQTNVLHAQISTGIKSIRYNADGGLSAEAFYDAASAAADNCPAGTVNASALLRKDGVVSLALLTSGAATRINVLNVVSGAVNCKSSLNYSQGPDTTAQHKAVNIVQTPDDKVYVLYQHETAPFVVRYDFDGTSLSNPQTIYRGLSNLGKTPLGMIARTSKRLLIGRPDTGALVEILIRGNEAEQSEFYKKTSFAKDLTALIAEPFN